MGLNMRGVLIGEFFSQFLSMMISALVYMLVGAFFVFWVWGIKQSLSFFSGAFVAQVQLAVYALFSAIALRESLQAKKGLVIGLLSLKLGLWFSVGFLLSQAQWLNGLAFVAGLAELIFVGMVVGLIMRGKEKNYA
jgi:hypothetical protein